MNRQRLRLGLITAAALLPLGMMGQETLTLEQCREMALQNNKSIEQAKTRVEMAGYDRKIARANYFPNISATGAYMYNEKNLALISDEMSGKLTGAGAALQGAVSEKVTNVIEALNKIPGGSDIISSEMGQAILGALQKGEISSAITKIGTEIDDAFHLNIHNVFAGMVSLQQPVFMGGKIINAKTGGRPVQGQIRQGVSGLADHRGPGLLAGSLRFQQEENGRELCRPSREDGARCDHFCQ